MQAQNQSQQTNDLLRATSYGNHAGAQLGDLTDLRRFFLIPDQDQANTRNRNLQIALAVSGEPTPNNFHIIRDCLISSAISHSASALTYSLGARPELYILVGVGTSCATREAFALYRFCIEDFTEVNQAPVDQNRLSPPNQAPIHTNSMSNNLGDLNSSSLSVQNQTHIQRYTNNPDTSRRCLLFTASLISSIPSLQAQCPNELSRFISSTISRTIPDLCGNAICYVTGGGFYLQRLYLQRGGRGNMFEVINRHSDSTTVPQFTLNASLEHMGTLIRANPTEPDSSFHPEIESTQRLGERSRSSSSLGSINSMN